MSELAAFSLKNRNPDVLSCIASLSNDEVFTPPELANQMLDRIEDAWALTNDGRSIWENPDVKILDPFSKSGVFLREATKRFVSGLELKIPDLALRVDHILQTQVFGIATTQLTALISRRSLYCSKWANGKHSIAGFVDSEDGNVWFESREHSWTAATEFLETSDASGKSIQRGTNGRCRYCGASQRDYDRAEGLESHAYALIHEDDPNALILKMFGDDMQFDVIVGNPPYQLGASGGDSVGGFAMPIYQKFIDAAKRLDPRFICMVTPARWYAGGRGLDEFRSEMLSDRRLRELVDFPDARDCFPGIDIKGGVSYFLWSRDDPGDCLITTMSGGSPTSPPMSRRLDDFDVLVRRNEAVPILEKVMKVCDSKGLGRLNERVSAIQPFSLRTTFKGSENKSGVHSPVLVYGNKAETWIPREDIPRNVAWVDQWKVLLGRAYGAGESVPHQIFNYPIIAAPGTACTETYLVIDRFDLEEEATRFALYLRSRFVRFLVSLRKNTQDLYSERFAFVPRLPMDREWLDADLYRYFGISKSEADFIAQMIRPMDVSDDQDD
jgi:hypothetical protein